MESFAVHIHFDCYVTMWNAAAGGFSGLWWLLGTGSPIPSTHWPHDHTAY